MGQLQPAGLSAGPLYSLVYLGTCGQAVPAAGGVHNLFLELHPGRNSNKGHVIYPHTHPIPLSSQPWIVDSGLFSLLDPFRFTSFSALRPLALWPYYLCLYLPSPASAGAPCIR